MCILALLLEHSRQLAEQADWEDTIAQLVNLLEDVDRTVFRVLMLLWVL